MQATAKRIIPYESLLDSVITNRHILQALPPSWLYHRHTGRIKHWGNSSLSSLLIEGLEAESSFIIPQLLPVHCPQPVLIHLSVNLKCFSGSPSSCAFSINASVNFTGESSSATVLLFRTKPNKLAPLLQVALGHNFGSSAAMLLSTSTLYPYYRCQGLFFCQILNLG